MPIVLQIWFVEQLSKHGGLAQRFSTSIARLPCHDVLDLDALLEKSKREFAMLTESQIESLGIETLIAALCPSPTFYFPMLTSAQIQNLSVAQLLSLSPAEKYDIFVGRLDFPLVLSERAHNQPNDGYWHGTCDGW